MHVYRIEHRTLFVGPWMWVNGPIPNLPQIDCEIRRKLGMSISASHGRFLGFFGGKPLPKWRFAFSHFDRIPSVFFEADVLRHFCEQGFVLREYRTPVVRPTRDRGQLIFDSGLAKLIHTFEL